MSTPLNTGSPAPFPVREGSHSIPTILAGALVLVAFAIRVVDLSAQSLWWDEAYSALLAAQGPRAIFRELRDFDFHPPLHYLLEMLWLPIAGRTEFALRFPALAAGVLTVAIGAATGRRLFGRGGYLSVGLVFALSPFLVYYSQEARMYAPAALLATLSLYLLLRARAADQWRWWGLYAGVCVLGLYTFYYFVFIPLVAAGYALLAPPRSLRRLVRVTAACAAIALGYAPWLPILLRRNAVWDSQWATTSSPAKIVGWTWQTLVLGIADPKLPAQSLVPALLIAIGVVGLIGLALSGWRSALDQPPAGSRTGAEGGGPGWGWHAGLALAAFIVPLALMAAIAAIKPVFHPRYAIAAVPGLCLALGGAIAGAWLPTRARWLRLTRIVTAGTLIALVLGAAGFGNLNLKTNPAYARDDYRAAVGYIQSRLGPTDTIIYNAHPGFTFYYHGAAPASFFPPAPYEEDAIADALTGLARGRDRIWYLRHFEVPTDPEGFVDQLLERGARKYDERWFGALRVTGYQLDPGRAFSGATITSTRHNLANRLALTGYSLAAGAIQSSGSLEVRLRWQVLGPTDDYGVWVGLTDAQGVAWGREDRQPRNSRLELSSRWQPGEVVTTRHLLPTLIGTPPGQYQVVAGVYRLSDVRGLDVLDELGRPRGQTVSLAPVTVSRATSPPVSDPALPGKLRMALTPSVELTGFGIDAARASPGGRLRLATLWHALGPGASATLVVRLTAGGSAPTTVATEILGGAYPASGWTSGEVVREQREIRLPATLSPGPATLDIGLTTSGREPERFVPLGPIDISAVTRTFDAPRLERPLDVAFGRPGAQPEISLLGARLASTPTKPGEKVRVTLYWQAIVDGATRYRVFTHLLDAAGEIRAQRDGEPRDWTHPTDGWLAGEVIEDTFEVELGKDVPPGEYDVKVGLYEPTSGARLVSGGQAQDYVIVGRVSVRP